MNSTKGFFLAEYKLVLGILLILVVGAIVVFNANSFTGLQVADVTPPVIFSLAHTPPTTPITGSRVNFIAEAKDNVGVASVEIYVDDQKVKTCSNKPPSPCTYWVIYQQTGQHSYYAKAYDAAGNSVRSPVSGSTKFQVIDNKAVPKGTDVSSPSVSVTVKTLQNDVNIPVNITATANDNVKVKSIEIYVGDGLVLTCPATPCVFLKQYPNIGRAQYYYAKAYDTSGNIGIAPPSGQKWFRVTGQPTDLTPPNLTVIACKGSCRFDIPYQTIDYSTGETVVLNATASDASGIQDVSIYLDGVIAKQCSSSRCTYSNSFNDAGTYTFYATSTDKKGNSGLDPASGTKSFTVSAPQPQKNNTTNISVSVVASYDYDFFRPAPDPLLSVNTSATSNNGVGIRSISTSFRNITDGKVWRKACFFSPQYPLNAVCNLTVPGSPSTGIHEYWGEVINKNDEYARDPGSGAKTVDCTYTPQNPGRQRFTCDFS